MSNSNQCPKCNSAGISVGAMNYKETQQWHSKGTMGGSGIGIGTFGMGIGLGGGRFTQEGESATKRANVFNEPELEHTDESFNKLLLMIAGLFSMGLLIYFALWLKPNANTNASLPFSSIINSTTAPIILVVFFLIFLFFYFINSKVEDKENQEREDNYPKLLNRYNELRYCESCNIIYDQKRNFENANKIGFHKMMQLKSDQQ